jgi:hypothetical protein
MGGWTNIPFFFYYIDDKAFPLARRYFARRGKESGSEGTFIFAFDLKLFAKRNGKG